MKSIIINSVLTLTNSHEHAEDDYNIPEGYEYSKVAQILKKLSDPVTKRHLTFIFLRFKRVNSTLLLTSEWHYVYK